MESTKIGITQQPKSQPSVLTTNDIKNYSLKALNAISFYMSFICHSMYSYLLACHRYVTRMYSYAIHMSPYVLVCHPYVTRMHSSACRSYVIRISLVCNRMLSVCHSYALACHPYVTRMSVYHSFVLACHPYVTRLWFYHKLLQGSPNGFC